MQGCPGVGVAGRGMGLISSPIPPAQSRQDLQDVGATPHRVTKHLLPGLVGKKGPGGHLWLDPSSALGTWRRAGLIRGACQGWAPSHAGSEWQRTDGSEDCLPLAGWSREQARGSG